MKHYGFLPRRSNLTNLPSDTEIVSRWLDESSDINVSHLDFAIKTWHGIVPYAINCINSSSANIYSKWTNPYPSGLGRKRHPSRFGLRSYLICYLFQGISQHPSDHLLHTRQLVVGQGWHFRVAEVDWHLTNLLPQPVPSAHIHPRKNSNPYDPSHIPTPPFGRF